MLALSAVLDEELASDIWYARVPSPSNPSDLPSRLVYRGFKTLDMSHKVTIPDDFWTDLKSRLAGFA